VKILDVCYILKHMNKNIIIGVVVVLAVLLTATLVWVNNEEDPSQKVLSYFNEHFFNGEGEIISVSLQDEDGREIVVGLGEEKITLFLLPSEQYVYINRFDMEPYMEIDDLGERVITALNEIISPNQGEDDEEIVLAIDSISEEDKDGRDVSVLINEEPIELHVSPSGRYLFLPLPEPPYVIKFDINEPPFEKPAEEEMAVGFIPTEDEICFEDGKPVIYYFGSTTCPHCEWERPVITEVAESFGDNIVFYDHTDTEEDTDVMMKYNPQGYIPMMVLGCRYYHIGAGENSGEEVHKGEITEIICELTNNQPAELCI
jgi:thiol-disulfide isomerase/thioredoxin